MGKENRTRKKVVIHPHGGSEMEVLGKREEGRGKRSEIIFISDIINYSDIVTSDYCDGSHQNTCK